METTESLLRQSIAEKLETENWDLVIKPHTSWFDLRLKEVWRYRDLVWLFVQRDFASQYKQTILGPVWHLIQPLLTTMIFLFLFGNVARIGTDGIQPVLFYMAGITIWNYFSACLTTTANTFLGNANIFGKVYFPRLVIPLSVVISNIIRFGIQFALLLAFMIAFVFKGVPLHLSFSWLLIPLLIMVMAGIALGLGIIISSLTTKYRDLSLFLTFAIQLGMYITPVAFPMSFLTGKSYQWVVNLNPIASIVESFRYCLFGKATITAGGLIYSVSFMLVSLGVGAIIFNKVEKDFIDSI
jgi:lipopolysaccharide transport system permease protein